MATLNLSVPNDLLRRAKARLGKNKQADVKDYLLSALEALTLKGTPIDAKTESKLLAGLNSPKIDASAAYWNQKIRKYNARHRTSKRV